MHRNHYQLYTKNYEINYLTMASSTLGLTLNRAPFPLIKEILMEESTFVEISMKVQVGGQGNNIQWEKRTTKICKIDHLNKELMMNSIIEFTVNYACTAGCLNLYSRFRELLGEVFCADWDNTCQGKANSVAGFHETLNKFISYHFSNTDLIDQKNMLAQAKKPFKYTVEVLCSRLRHLNKLMSKLPGANNRLPYDKGALKIELFKMMLSNWQINFNNAGLDIMDDAYTLQRLVHFMTVQEATFNAIQERKQSVTTMSPAHCTPAHLGGGHVTSQQGHHGGRGLPGRAAVHGAGGGAEGNCPFHPGVKLGDVFCQSTWAKLLARFPSKLARGAARGGRGNHAGSRGQPCCNQDVHFVENPVEEAEEHGYEEEPTLQNDMDTEAEGHGGEPSQE
jgi:hypothetical protein